MIYLAGQIPLDPGSMTITPGGFSSQARLAVANTQAVAVAAGGCVAAASLGLTIYLADAAAGAAARREVQALLRDLRADAVGFAARAERERTRRSAPGFAGAAAASAGEAAGGGGEGSGDEEEEGGQGEEGHIDEYLRPPQTALRLRPPVVFLGVPELPRG
jgi:enamine deaminase RidA (YjgF/YER057c/UK114 family)